MLLRLRVVLPDRPGSLGQVARTLGVVGADIVSVVVLERVGGRAVDDFTVVWPASAQVDRVLTGLAAVPGVRVDGVWRGTELSEPSSGREVALIGQVAANPDHGLATVVDAAPALFGADWAVAILVGSDWAGGGARTQSVRPAWSESSVVCASWRAPVVPPQVDIAPLRPRAASAADGVHLAVAPFQRGGLVLVVGRGGAEGDAGAPPFHGSEVERLAQLVGATASVLGDRLAGPGLAEPGKAGSRVAGTPAPAGTTSSWAP
ncbi:amino acid-binding protein [Dactylosporangium sp. NPDC000555]|uniref:amino acid-binding protein n=1 Tax=Dactylosporangium sp. NPDC000555 TaxID=3154260 RepID=UPI00331B8988